MHFDLLPFIHDLVTQIHAVLAAAPMPTIHINCNEINPPGMAGGGACPSNTPDVGTGFRNFANVIVGIIGGLSVVMVIYNGLQMTLSNGNAKRFAQGRMGLFYSIVGVALAIAAYAIVAFIAGALN